MRFLHFSEFMTFGSSITPLEMRLWFAARRQVLWQIVEVAALLSGPKMNELLEISIATLDARFEGMARTVGRHDPYLNSVLTKRRGT